MYNYMDYQFINNTAHTFHLIIYTTDEHLCGELRCDTSIGQAYHIEERNAYFSQLEDTYFRHNEVFVVLAILTKALKEPGLDSLILICEGKT